MSQTLPASLLTEGSPDGPLPLLHPEPLLHPVLHSPECSGAFLRRYHSSLHLLTSHLSPLSRPGDAGADPRASMAGSPAWHPANPTPRAAALSGGHRATKSNVRGHRREHSKNTEGGAAGAGRGFLNELGAGKTCWLSGCLVHLPSHRSRAPPRISRQWHTFYWQKSSLAFLLVMPYNFR